jgi:hypothetical protein
VGIFKNVVYPLRVEVGSAANQSMNFIALSQQKLGEV